MSTNFCPNCGAAVDHDTQFCQNCGASITDSGAAPSKPAQPAYSEPPPQESFGTTPAYEQPATTTYAPKKSDDSGMISLIFGVLSCVGILPCIGGIVAIITGHSAKSKGDSQYANIGLILGYLSIAIYVIGAIIGLALWFTGFWWYF